MTAQLLPTSLPAYRCDSSSARRDPLLANSPPVFRRLCGRPSAYHSAPAATLAFDGQFRRCADGFPAGVFPAIRPQRHVVFGARPCPPPRLALLSLGHPLGAFPAPCGNFAALLFRFLPQEISRANSARLRPSAGEISCGYLPKKRRSPLGAGHTRVALRGVFRVRFGQFKFGGKENGTLRKQHPA
jgi:hypothetical protein